MRVQHVAQAVKGWATAAPDAAEQTTMLDDAVTRLRWRLWHGQTERALTLIGDLLTDLDAALEAADDPPARKVAALLRALETYVVGQADLIIDYAAARHRGEAISTATTESTVQRLPHRRMGANQHMRWSPRGAHRMLKVRTAVMNGTLAADHVAAVCSGLLGQQAAEAFQARAGHVDPTRRSQPALFPEHDLSEGAMDIHSNDASHDGSPS